MKTIVLKALHSYLAGAVMVALILPACFSASGQENDKLKSSIEEINSRFVDLFGSGNADTLASFYTADAHLMIPGAPAMSGTDNIVTYWQGAINAGINNVKLETTDVSGCGNEVIEYGKYTIFAGDNFAVDNGKFIVIWKKAGKEWKIFRDIFNSDNPPPIARSVLNDTVLIIYNYVKADKVEDFKKFNNEFLHPLFLKENNAAAMSARMLEPLRANEDGTYTYIYLMDPVVSTPGAYAFLPPLSKEYGEERAREIIKEGFTDALARPQVQRRFVVRLTGR
ncbi:MAG: nuclear transport factor 2 family protein [Bacteroidales bacterium]|nr:nuclear transport factor 2 family protein [Bacteroidales bacterium]MDT8373726.1 nuclear transport factor 2 family protein [Bacteroidales bacterium]